MDRLFLSGSALTLLTGGALAQAALPAPAGAPSAPMSTTAPPPPPGGPEAIAPGAAPPPPPLGMGAGAPPPPGGPGATVAGAPGAPPPGGPRGQRPPPPPPPKAAHVRIEHGDLALDVKCPDDEPMKACADLTLQLLDKLQAMPGPANGPVAPGPAAPKS